MPLGGFFSSASKSATTTTNQAFNTGFSEVAGQATSINLSFTGSVGKKGRATYAPVINLTDQGAVRAAQSIAEQSQRNVEVFSGTVAEAIAGAISSQRETTLRAIAAGAEARRGEVENVSLAAVKWGALALAVYAGARIFWKGA